MKNYFFTLLLIFIFFNTTMAQVGIGNTNPKATLDITASNVATPSNIDGILIPRINAFPVTNPTAAQDGMMVFLTTTKAFYFWNWNINTSSGVWESVTGVEKINDLIDGRSDNDGTNNGSSIYLGIGTGVNDDLSDNGNVGIGLLTMNSNTTGEENVAIGVQALTTNSTSSFNTAIGSFALQNTKKGSNTAIGRSSLSSNTLGEENVAIGALSSTDNTTGNFNTVIGNAAGRFNKTGNNNTFLGFEAGFISSLNTNKSGVIAIGYQAGKDRNRNNSLFIENSNADENNALIYGEFDTNLLRVNGELQIGNQTTTGFKFPTARGTNNQVLKTNASGVLSWANDTSEIDHDFYKVGTTLPPTTITDDIFTNGKVGINKIAPISSLDLVDTSGNTAFNIFINDSPGPATNTLTVGINNTISNNNNALTTGGSIGLFNKIDIADEGIGVFNNMTIVTTTSIGEIYGTKQYVSTFGSGEVYGTYSSIEGSLSGDKFGSFIRVFDDSPNGTNYGIYSESLTGFAGYFLGRVSIGTTNLNNYLFPSSRGTNAQVMQTDGSGNVSWVTLPSESLDWKLTGNTGTNTATNFIGTTDNIDLVFRTNNIQRIILNTSGNLGVNVTNPQDVIHVNGGIRTEYIPSSYWVTYVDSQQDYNFAYSGTLKSYIQDTDGSYNIFSDRRLKNNIQEMDTSVIQKVMQLNPVTYSYKSDSTNKKQDGFIAQEVQKLFPELVSEKKTENGEFLTLRYDAFGVLAIRTIQEQQKEINTLKIEITELKKLEARILLLEKNSD